MKFARFQFASALGAALLVAATAVAQQPAPSASSSGQNIVGTVTNLTTGAPLAHSRVTLLLLQNGMQTVTTTTTTAEGRFRFSQSTPGQYLVEADYQNVPYFAQVTPGQGETNVKVYDAVGDAKLLQVDAEILVLQPDQGQLAVVNEYRIENGTQPPRTLSAQGGMFRFRVPDLAHVDMVRVVGPGELPLARAATPTAQHDVFSVDSPLRPGETKIQVSYRVPYPALRTVLTDTPVTPPAHFEVYVPNPMSFDGAGFTQVGAQDGYVVYGVVNAKMPDTFSFQISGDAPLPAAAASPNTEGQGGSGANSGAAADTGTAASPGGAGQSTAGGTTAASLESRAAAALVPARTYLEKNLWIVLAILGLGAAGGFGLLLAKGESRIEAEAPVAVAVAMASTPGSLAAGVPLVGLPPPTPPPPKFPSALPSGNLKQASALPPAPEALSKLKDDLFLLEVRLHTGNIDEAEYARLRAEINLRINRLSGR